MHEAVKNSRDLVILFTRDYEQSPYTRKGFTSFEADRAQSQEKRHIIVLRNASVALSPPLNAIRGVLDAHEVLIDVICEQSPSWLVLPARERRRAGQVRQRDP